MTNLGPFFIIGLAIGSVYAIAGLGLVLTFKVSGIFNFAHGAVATVGAYVFYELSVRRGLPWPLAALIAIVGVGLVLGVLLERIAHRLSQVSLAMKIVGTIGLLVGTQGMLELVYGTGTFQVPTFLPSETFVIGGLFVGYDQVIMVMLALGLAYGLYVFFGRTRLGLAMRAVVDDAELLESTGYDGRRVRTWAWMMGSAFAAASGVLLAPTVGVDTLVLTLLVVQAFGAAAIGGFSNLALTYVGGLVLGVGGSVATEVTRGWTLLSGVPPALPFIILVLVLVIRRKGSIFDVDAGRVLEYGGERVSSTPRFSHLVVGLSALAVVPLIAGPRLALFTNAAILGIVFLSFDVLIRTSGQVSLAHASFVAVGAATAGQLMSTLGVPWLPALLVAGAVTTMVAAIVAVPAIRLSGLYLAVATFGFGIMLEFVFYRTPLMFGRGSEALAVTRPRLPGIPIHTDVGFYYVVVGFLLTSAVLVGAVERGRLGRLLRGLANAPVTLATLGAETNITRVLVFCLSGLLAGVAGALGGSLTGFVSGRGLSWLTSLQWLLVLAVIVSRFSSRLVGAVLFGVSVSIVPGLLGAFEVRTHLSVLFGVVGVVVSFFNGRFPEPDVRAILRHLREGVRDRQRSPVAERMVVGREGFEEKSA